MNDGATMSWSEWGLVIFLSVLWGGSFFFAKVAVVGLPPLTIVFIRFAAAALLVLAYVRAQAIPIPADHRSWAAFAGMGLLNNLVPAGLIVWGQTRIPSGLAAVIIAMTPVFSILAIRCTSRDERLTVGKLAGMVLGLAGVGVLLRLGATQPGHAALPGIAACLAAAVSYGFANALGKRFRALGIPPAVGAMGQMATSAAMALPLMLAVDRPWRLAAPGIEVWVAMIGLAALSTALGYVVFFRLLATAGATNVSLVTLLIPLSAVLLGSLVLGERVAADQVVGMALIALGLLAIDGRLLRWRRG